MSDLRRFLSRPAAEVAPELLGWRLTHTTGAGTVAVELTEVEAYAGESDPASHAYRGRTHRNAVMFGPAGPLYVYFSYGIHWCANIVCDGEDRAGAVLLRAGRVVGGVDLARRRRGARVPDRGLARGPATLTQALGIAGADSGTDLLVGAALRLDPPVGRTSRPVSRGPRVGVSRAAEVPWRFWVTGDERVSAYKRNPRAERPAVQRSQ